MHVQEEAAPTTQVHIGLLRGIVKLGTLDLKYSFHAISPPVVELFVYYFFGCCNCLTQMHRTLFPGMYIY
jgi:hypothetical protein